MDNPGDTDNTKAKAEVKEEYFMCLMLIRAKTARVGRLKDHLADHNLLGNGIYRLKTENI